MVEIRFYRDNAEIERDAENWTFVNVGFGSASIADMGYDVYVPNTVAHGNEGMESYIRISVNRIKERGRVPVVVFPYKTEEPGSTPREKKNLAISMDDRYRFFDIAASIVDVIYVQCFGRLFTIDDSSEIDRFKGMIRHGKDGLVIQVGRGVFYTEYLKDTAFYSTDDDMVIRNKRVSSQTLETMVDRILKEIEGSSRKIAFFTIVFQYEGSAGERGTFDVPDGIVMAKIITRFNEFSMASGLEFDAVFTTFKIPSAMAQIKIAEYEEQYKGKIKGVFERSVAIRDSSREVTEKEELSWRTLEFAFPKNTYNHVDMTFVDAEETSKLGNKRPRPIAELMSPRKLKPVKEEYKPAVVNAVNFLINKRRDRTQKATVRADTAIKKFSRSLAARERVRSVSAAKAVEKITGRYPLDDGHDFIITDDPVAIFSKATGQDWEEESCEKDGGSHNLGVYSDIELGNCVVFIVEKETDHPVARLMLRWCDEDDGHVGFGIEGRWYYTTSPGHGTKAATTDRTLLYQGMPAAKATAFVAKILQEKGMYDYSTCTTPYYYGGYSDVSRASNVKIQYQNLFKTSKDVKKYLTQGKINVAKTPMRDLAGYYQDFPEELDALNASEMATLFNRLASGEDVSASNNLTVTLFRQFGANLFEMVKPLVSISAGPGSPIYFTVLEKTLVAVEALLFRLRDKGWQEILDMLGDADISSNSRVLAKILAFIGIVGPSSVCASVPKSFAMDHGDSPLVLMSLLVVYDHGKNDAAFSYCVGQLASLYKLKNLTAKLRARSEKISEGSQTACYGDRKFVLNGKYFCERDCTDELFITRRPKDNKIFDIGISVITAWNDEYIPLGFSGPGSARRYWNGDIEARVQSAVDKLDSQLLALSKTSDEDFTARYPAS